MAVCLHAYYSSFGFHDVFGFSVHKKAIFLIMVS